MAKMTVKNLILKLQEMDPKAKVYFRDQYTPEEYETPLMIDCSLPQKKGRMYLTWHPDFTR